MTPEQAKELAAMVEVLAEAGYMDWSKNAIDLRRTKAQQLTHLGIDHMMMAVLWRQAQREAAKNASGLFACWMKEQPRLMAAIERLRKRNAFQQQAVKDTHKEQRIKQQDAASESTMRDNIRRLSDFKRNA